MNKQQLSIMKYFKQLLFTIALLVPMVLQASERIVLTIQYEEPEDWYPPVKRMPSVPIYVIQESHVLIFNGVKEGVLEIKDGDKVLFWSPITGKCELEIPSTISGELDLSLKIGTKLYGGEINL